MNPTFTPGAFTQQQAALLQLGFEFVRVSILNERDERISLDDLVEFRASRARTLPPIRNLYDALRIDRELPPHLKAVAVEFLVESSATRKSFFVSVKDADHRRIISSLLRQMGHAELPQYLFDDVALYRELKPERISNDKSILNPARCSATSYSTRFDRGVVGARGAIPGLPDLEYFLLPSLSGMEEQLVTRFAAHNKLLRSARIPLLEISVSELKKGSLADDEEGSTWSVRRRRTLLEQSDSSIVDLSDPSFRIAPRRIVQERPEE